MSKNISIHNKRVAVIGIGRVGLALSLCLAKEGFDTVGIDIDKDRLESLKSGKLPFIEKGAQKILTNTYGKGFSVVHEEALPYIFSSIDVFILTLGTTIDSSLSPSVSQITDFLQKYRNLFRSGQLLVLRSTLTPGTTEYVLRFIQENTELSVGKDIFLACCPERIAEGHAIDELYETPQIIGTFDKKSADLAAEVFKKFTENIHFTDPRSAELAKLYCNMYRYIDFAIGNEFMLIAETHERDIYEILKLVNNGYKRGGVKGPGFTAGACLVKDGFFLIDKSPFLDLIAAAWRVNESIPGFLLNKLKSHFENMGGKKVALLGLGFKRDIDDTRYSLSLKLKQYLDSEGSVVITYDPFLETVSLEDTLIDAEIVILAINHSKFEELNLSLISQYVKPNCVVCDLWNILGTGKIVYPLKDYISIALKNGESKDPPLYKAL